MNCSTPDFLSFTISRSLLKLMSIESVMPSNHLILCCPLLLLPSVFPSIRVLFPVSQLLASGGQNIGTSDSASVLPVNIQYWYPLVLTGLISLSLLQPHNLKASILWHSTFFCGPFFVVSHLYMSAGKTIALTVWIFVGKVMSLLFATLCKFVRAFLLRSKEWNKGGQAASLGVCDPFCLQLVGQNLVT